MVLPLKKNNLSWSFVIVIIGILLSILSGWFSYNYYQQKELSRLELENREVTILIKTRMKTYEQVLRSGAALFAASDNLNHYQWELFANTLKLNESVKGIQAFGYCEVVLPKDKELHEARIRKEGFPNYLIKPAGKREMYVPVIYVTPFEGTNKKALGYDVFSEKVRREALIKAILSDQPIITGKVQLVQEDAEAIKSSFLMYLPVYKKNSKHNTPQERILAIQGFISAPFRANDLMYGLLGRLFTNVHFELYDGTFIKKENLLYDSNLNTKNMVPYKRTTLILDGRTWTLIFKRNNSLDNQLLYPILTIPAFILLLTAFLYLLLSSLIKRKRVAIQRSNELLISNATIVAKENLLQILLDSITEGMYGIDETGTCTFVNKSFLRLLGYEDENEVLGKNIHNVIHHTHKDGSPCSSGECKIYKGNQSGEAYYARDEVFWKQDGTSIDVAYWSHPIVNKSYIGSVVTFLDISEENRLKRERQYQDQKMLQQSRLAQMGEMISMIAHQWRQPLTAISLAAINIKIDVELESFDLDTKEGRDAQNTSLLEEVGYIETYIDNLTTTINDFRNFYKKDKEMVSNSFKEVVQKSLAIINRSFKGENIAVEEEYGDEIIFEMYDHEIMQVILNILKNAQDNFKEKTTSNPQIKITSKHNTLSISDNGGGIPDDILDKIFDPYFSTKSEKNGTGLGLYMSKTIIEDHHDGKLSAYNQNNGVCFEITIRMNHYGS